jgi:hypothetical protein
VRILILLLALLVIALAVPILFQDHGPARPAPVFDAIHLIADAAQGETATYRDESGNTWTLTVEGVVPGASDREPRIRILAVHADREGHPVPGGVARYEHRPVTHGIFPLMSAVDPSGYDRLWVWTRLRRETITWRGEQKAVWRFDLLDPALPTEGGADHVVAWMSEDLPVFGLVRFQRRGRTWDLVDWGPRS